jgi:hypothetical protein
MQTRIKKQRENRYARNERTPIKGRTQLRSMLKTTMMKMRQILRMQMREERKKNRKLRLYQKGHRKKLKEYIRKT